MDKLFDELMKKSIKLEDIIQTRILFYMIRVLLKEESSSVLLFPDDA